MAIPELETTPRDIMIAQMIRRLAEWHHAQLDLVHTLGVFAEASDMTPAEKDGYAAAMASMAEILSSFPLHVEKNPDSKKVLITVFDPQRKVVLQ